MFAKGHRNTTRRAAPLKTHEYGSPSQRNEWVARLGAPKASAGSKLLKRYYSGDILTPRQQCKAFCCECMGFYADGMHDCETPRCPLYPTMPYKAGRREYQRPDRKPGQPYHIDPASGTATVD
jgi:hypothetical protein